MTRLLLWILPFVCGAGCAPVREGARAEPGPAPEFTREGGEAGIPPGPVPREGAGDLALARVGGAEIRRSDLGDFVTRFFREEANKALTHLVDERIIDAEALALGVGVSPEMLASEVDRELAKRENGVRVEYGADISLERYLRERYGVSLAEHRRDLGRLVRTRLLRDRVIRLRQFFEDRVEARHAVFEDLEQARRASESARAGADLEALAADRGLRPAGVLPLVPREAISPPELADLVFSLREGEVSEPVSVTEDGRRLYHVFKILRRLPARRAAWGEVRSEIEKGLLEKPLESHEYLRWSRVMRERYGLEMLR